MKALQRSTMLAALLTSTGFAGIGSQQEARCIGFFPIAFRPIPVTLDSLKQASVRAEARIAAGRKPSLVRVGALVNNSFSATDLKSYGWRLISRIGNVVTLEGSRESAPYLGALTGIRYVKMPSRVYPVMDSARRDSYVNQLQKTVPGWTGPRLTGKHVLYGLIDTDFDTHHKAFQDSNGVTRFVAVWDQNDSTRRYPDRFGYGSIANHRQLLTDSLFSLHQGFHGTCMASYAAGSQWSCPFYGVAPDVSIAGVAMDTSDQGIIDGLSWLFSLADSLRLPCVVSMSLGSPEGPHDGTSLIDQVIDSVSQKPGHIVVGAVGNEGANLHAHVPLQPGSGQSIGTWLSQLYADNVYLYGIEMWGEAGDTFTVKFNILDTAANIYYKSIDSLSTSKGKPGQQLNYEPIFITFVDSVTKKRDTVYFPVLLTEDASSLNGKPHLQAYMYTSNPKLHFGVSITVAGKSGGTVQAWSLYQNAFQSYQVPGFIDGDTTMSVTELGGTAKDNITVGAYYDNLVIQLYNSTWFGINTGLYDFAPYSGRGPTADGRIKPDITAPGSQVIGAMARDIDTTNFNIAYWPDYPFDTLDSRYAVAGGTSCTAPIVAGIVADMLQADSVVTYSQARELLQETATTDTATGIITASTYNNLWGAGKANALGALGKLLGISATLPTARGDIRSSLGLKKLPGNRLLFTGVLRTPTERLTFEYFSVNGRLSRKLLLAKGVTVDSYNSLPCGIYLARVRDGSQVLSETTVSMVNKE
jgi:minor extracellular serine protease Vpr